jgi:SAM-dependent methyltransferase
VLIVPSVTRLIRRRLPFVYRMGRAAFEASANRLPPWTLPPIPGPVSRADLMLGASLVQRPSAEQVVAYDAAGRQAAALLAAAVTESGRATADVGAVLDLGCGHGRVARHLGTTFPNARISGCDLDPNAAAFCRRHLGMDAEPVGADPRQLPKGPFDVIWMGSVLTHIDEAMLRSMLREVTARLTDAGVAIFTTHPPEVVDLHDDVVPAEVLAELERSGFYYRPYPHSADGSYGLAFSTPAQLEATVAEESTHPVRKVFHRHREWATAQDVWAFARA